MNARWTGVEAARAGSVLTLLAARHTLSLMTDIRDCAQCGGLFAPRREHARFCSARCRVAWNRLNTGAPGTGDDVLDWSVTAMRDTADRLLHACSSDRPACHALISEAVWWSTMVDATMVRYHPNAHAAALARRDAADRRVIESTFGGLRFVRNMMGIKADPEDFLEPAASTSGRPGDQVANWTWKHVPGPGLADLAPRAQEWEQARHRAYQAQLAGQRVGDTFSLAASFLAETAERRLAPGRA
jgi:hypothetical protein